MEEWIWRTGMKSTAHINAASNALDFLSLVLSGLAEFHDYAWH
jgi:hypothetical protein